MKVSFSNFSSPYNRQPLKKNQIKNQPSFGLTYFGENPTVEGMLGIAKNLAEELNDELYNRSLRAEFRDSLIVFNKLAEKQPDKESLPIEEMSEFAKQLKKDFGKISLEPTLRNEIVKFNKLVKEPATLKN